MFNLIDSECSQFFEKVYVKRFYIMLFCFFLFISKTAAVCNSSQLDPGEICCEDVVCTPERCRTNFDRIKNATVTQCYSQATMTFCVTPSIGVMIFTIIFLVIPLIYTGVAYCCCHLYQGHCSFLSTIVTGVFWVMVLEGAVCQNVYEYEIMQTIFICIATPILGMYLMFIFIMLLSSDFAFNTNEKIQVDYMKTCSTVNFDGTYALPDTSYCCYIPYLAEMQYPQVALADIYTIHQVNVSSPPKPLVEGVEWYWTGSKNRTFTYSYIAKQYLNYGSWENTTEVKPIKLKKQTIVYRCYLQWEGGDDMTEEIERARSVATEEANQVPARHHNTFPVYLLESEVSPHVVATDSNAAMRLTKNPVKYLYLLLMVVGYQFIIDLIWESLVERRYIVLVKHVYSDPDAGKLKKDEPDKEALQKLEEEHKADMKESLIP